MGEAGDVIKAEHGAGTFDGVHGPEDPVDQILILRGFLKLKQ